MRHSSVPRPRFSEDIYQKLLANFPDEDRLFLEYVAAWYCYSRVLAIHYPKLDLIAYENLFGLNGLEKQKSSLMLAIRLLEKKLGLKFPTSDLDSTCSRLSSVQHNRSYKHYVPKNGKRITDLLRTVGANGL